VPGVFFLYELDLHAFEAEIPHAQALVHEELKERMLNFNYL